MNTIKYRFLIKIIFVVVFSCHDTKELPFDTISSKTSIRSQSVWNWKQKWKKLNLTIAILALRKLHAHAHSLSVIYKAQCILKFELLIFAKTWWRWHHLEWKVHKNAGFNSLCVCVCVRCICDFFINEIIYA